MCRPLQDGDVRRRFYQLRVMEFLVRELCLEWEVQQHRALPTQLLSGSALSAARDPVRGDGEPAAVSKPGLSRVRSTVPKLSLPGAADGDGQAQSASLGSAAKKALPLLPMRASGLASLSAGQAREQKANDSKPGPALSQRTAAASKERPGTLYEPLSAASSSGASTQDASPVQRRPAAKAKRQAQRLVVPKLGQRRGGGGLLSSNKPHKPPPIPKLGSSTAQAAAQSPATTATSAAAAAAIAAERAAQALAAKAVADLGTPGNFKASSGSPAVTPSDHSSSSSHEGLVFPPGFVPTGDLDEDVERLLDLEDAEQVWLPDVWPNYFKKCSLRCTGLHWGEPEHNDAAASLSHSACQRSGRIILIGVCLEAVELKWLIMGPSLDTFGAAFGPIRGPCRWSDQESPALKSALMSMAACYTPC